MCESNDTDPITGRLMGILQALILISTLAQVPVGENGPFSTRR